ncbi:MAG: SDR family oxidoreductase [Acidimicrobiales bacterium]
MLPRPPEAPPWPLPPNHRPRPDRRSTLVTGGTKGAWAGITERFLEAGADVVVTAQALTSRWRPVGGRRHVRRRRDLDQIDDLVAVVTQHGRFDVLVNSTGGSPNADAATASPRFRVDHPTEPAGPAQPGPGRQQAIMQAQDGGGSIINIGSVSGMRPSPWTAAYGAAKAGLVNLSQSLAIEWAPRVRVNVVTGGYVLTEQSHLHYGDEEGLARVAATVPLGKLAQPSDLGDACLFLASPLAAHVTGANLAVHGGGEIPPFLAAAAGAG